MKRDPAVVAMTDAIVTALEGANSDAALSALVHATSLCCLNVGGAKHGPKLADEVSAYLKSQVLSMATQKRAGTA